MSRRKIVARLAAGLTVSALLVGACAKDEGDSEALREIIEETLVEPHRFVYTETTPGGTETVVQGIVEDDFRYKARLLVDDEPVLDRVVSDDTAAVRFAEPDVLGKYIDKEVVSEVDTETDRAGVDVFAALQSQRWVVDPGGAPPLLQEAEDETENGVDPIFDALDLVDKARDLTLLQGTQFIEYRETSISPVYRTDEDPFPRPEDGSGVTRYDLPQVPFPKTVDAGQVVIPTESQFRKFSVYVKDDRVIRISESIGLTPSVLEDFETFMVQLIAETAPAEVAEGFRSQLAELSGEEKGQFLLDGVNTFHELRGDPLLRFRTATYELLDIGDPSLEVEVPASDTVEGDLAVLVNLGVKPLVEEDEEGVADDDAADGEEVATDDEASDPDEGTGAADGAGADGDTSAEGSDAGSPADAPAPEPVP